MAKASCRKCRYFTADLQAERDGSGAKTGKMIEKSMGACCRYPIPTSTPAEYLCGEYRTRKGK